MRSIFSVLSEMSVVAQRLEALQEQRVAVRFARSRENIDAEFSQLLSQHEALSKQAADLCLYSHVAMRGWMAARTRVGNFPVDAEPNNDVLDQMGKVERMAQRYHTLTNPAEQEQPAGQEQPQEAVA